MGLLFIVRLVLSVQGQLYVTREMQLTKAPAALIKEKCHLIDKSSSSREEGAGGAQGDAFILRQCPEGERVIKLPSLTDACREVTTT